MSIEQLFVKEDDGIKVALEVIENSVEKIALIVDADKRLVGTVTDGDIRRGLLKGFSLDDRITEVMNNNPVVSSEGESLASYKEDMVNGYYRHLPIVNSNGQPLKLLMSNEVIDLKPLKQFAVIMAGGLGLRLRPLTEFVPKPMLEIEGKPVLLRLIERLKLHGITDIFISVNYRKEVIQQYFGNGKKFGVNIQYIIEDEPLGTAGSLRLIKNPPNEPCLVLNADLITKVDFNSLLAFHKEHKGLATICIRMHHLEIPYGVVDLEDDGSLVGIAEKPLQNFFINAGIYVLEPSVFQYIPRAKRFDMTQLLEKVIANNSTVKAFVCHEQWLDVGTKTDMQKAKLLSFDRGDNSKSTEELR